MTLWCEPLSTSVDNTRHQGTRATAAVSSLLSHKQKHVQVWVYQSALQEAGHAMPASVVAATLSSTNNFSHGCGKAAASGLGADLGAGLVVGSHSGCRIRWGGGGIGHARMAFFSTALPVVFTFFDFLFRGTLELYHRFTFTSSASVLDTVSPLEAGSQSGRASPAC